MSGNQAREYDAVARRLSAAKDTFFRRLLVSDAGVQKSMLSLVSEELTAMIETRDEHIDDYFPTVARLAREAPFKAVRETMETLQSAIEGAFPESPVIERVVSTGQRVSYFLDNGDIESVSDNEDKEIDALFRMAFLRTGRVSHFVQLLAWHKSYLQLYQQSIVSVMVRDGALPLHWRSYIALMAASELRCHYLADLQQYYFVVNGGDAEWTKGLDYVSAKLFRLHELSSLLAHRPWLLTPKHIADLLASNQDDSWSVSELVHAIIVLCQYHSMSSIALGLGCAEEADVAIVSDYDATAMAEQQAIHDLQFPNGMAIPENPPSNEKALSSSSGSLTDQDLASIERDEAQLLKRLKMHDGSDTTEDDDDEAQEYNGDADGFEMEGVFEITEEDTGYELDADGSSSRRRDTLWRFCGGDVIRYADFDVRSEDYKVLHTEDFSWEEHGFSLVRRYFPGEAGQILDDQFKLTSRLTYDFYGSAKEGDVDTSPYRNAIWYYVHRIFGICHDDYDYRQVNEFLNRPTKIFIKKVACTPWKVTKDDFEHFDHSLSPSEKCHVTLLVAEARKQAGLMYGLRAVMEHMR